MHNVNEKVLWPIFGEFQSKPDALELQKLQPHYSFKSQYAKWKVSILCSHTSRMLLEKYNQKKREQRFHELRAKMKHELSWFLKAHQMTRSCAFSKLRISTLTVCWKYHILSNNVCKTKSIVQTKRKRVHENRRWGPREGINTWGCKHKIFL